MRIAGNSSEGDVYAYEIDWKKIREKSLAKSQTRDA